LEYFRAICYEDWATEHPGEAFENAIHFLAATFLSATIGMSSDATVPPVTSRIPRGEHQAEWDEVVERFGWNERRRRLIDGLEV
jgi:hypothetical protein